MLESSTNQGILLCLHAYRGALDILCASPTERRHQIPNPKTRYMTKATSMIVVDTRETWQENTREALKL
jgi:hypothetical protein